MNLVSQEPFSCGLALSIIYEFSEKPYFLFRYTRELKPDGVNKKY